MGAAVWIEKAEFRMSASGERAAIATLKSTFPSEAIFLSSRIHEKPAAYLDLVSATTLAGAIRPGTGLGEHILVHRIPEGGVSAIGREGMVDELPARATARFFAPIARFVEPGSFIEFESDHAGNWTRFEFQNGVLRVVERELGADELGDWGVIEHDRTEVLLDPTL